MSQKVHTKIINNVAKQILKPEGLVRKGQSRTWYHDQGWFTTVVSFEPSKSRRGAYLSLGVNFHWYEKEYFSYDIGGREKVFEEFTTEAQFTPKIEEMVNFALTKVFFYSEKLSTLTTAKPFILSHQFTSDSLWGNYHRGVASGLLGDVDNSKIYFLALLNYQDERNIPWIIDLKTKTQELVDLVDRTKDFNLHVHEIITKTRAKKKLKEVEVELK